MSWLLPRLIGVARANDLLLSSRVFTVEETAEWGMWNGVRDTGEATLGAALDYAHMLSTTAGPTAVRTTKQQIYDDLLRHDVGASIADANRLLGQATGTAEYREGVEALRQKRPPNF